jgi:hypothetical protein
VKARIYSDSFAAPFEVSATLDIGVVDNPTDLKTLLPDWREKVTAAEERIERIKALTILPTKT